VIHECPKCGARNRIAPAHLDRVATCGACKTRLGNFDAPVDVTEAVELEDAVAHSPLPVLVDFWAPWCPPCRAVAPEIARVARERGGRVLVLKVNTEAVPASAEKYGIRSIPTMILFRGGREEKRASGARPADAIVSTFQL
jgi:thioredoxin 2